MDSIWIGILMVLAGTLLLRWAGRRSISQMTFSSVIVMLALGTVIAEPISQKNPWWTLAAAVVMLGSLMILEWLQMRFNALERLVSGKAKIVIENGVIQEKTMRRLRMSSDKLEMRLRQVGVHRISDVKTATIEVNGELGYELKPEAAPLTMGQFQQMMGELFPQILQATNHTNRSNETKPNIFDEIYDPRKNESHPKHLQ